MERSIWTPKSGTHTHVQILERTFFDWLFRCIWYNLYDIFLWKHYSVLCHKKNKQINIKRTHRMRYSTYLRILKKNSNTRSRNQFTTKNISTLLEMRFGTRDVFLFLVKRLYVCVSKRAWMGGIEWKKFHKWHLKWANADLCYWFDLVKHTF